jgi:patatin-like phospholipase/acyl hydrolase
MVDPITELSICGGGVRGFGFLGALYYLWERKLLHYSNLKTVACVSIGSWLGVGLCMGLSPKEIGDYFFGIDTSTVKDVDLINLFERKSILKGDKLREFITNFIKLRYKEDITLSELYAESGIRLIITTVCVNNSKVYYLDHISNPNLGLGDAVIMSSSIPGLFPPFKYNNRLYIDGGIVANDPIHILSENAWGICNDDNFEHSDVQINNMVEYTICIIQSVYKNINSIKRHSKQRLINVRSDEVAVTSFSLSKDVKFELFQEGIQCTRDQVNRMILQESLVHTNH